MTMLRYTGRHTGAILTRDYDGRSHWDALTSNDWRMDGETVSCCHCQIVMMIRPGSGIKRGFCFRCNAVTCGKKGCMVKCVPFERAIEEMEARGRLLAYVDEQQAEARHRLERSG